MEATDNSVPVTFTAVLRNRQFLALWLAQLVSSFGDWLALMAVFSLVTFRWNGTPQEIAGIFLAFAAPFALFGPLAGVFVDRFDLKRTMVASDLLRALLAAALVFAGGVGQVYLLLLGLSAVSTFFLPAQGAMIPLLVRKEELLVANALNAQTIHLNKIVGPAVAGLLVAHAGAGTCFALDALSFVASAALLARLRASRRPLEARGGAGAVLRDLRAGLRFVLDHAALRFALGASVAAIFAIGMFDALIAVYVRDVLGSGSQLFGGLVSSIGVGTIVGAAVIGRYGQAWSRVALIALGILGLGLGVALLALATRSPAAVGASLFLGVSVSAVFIPGQTLIQEETPPALLGRVSSTGIALVTVSQLIGVALAGRVAELTGIRALYYGVAAILMLTGLLGFALGRRLPAPGGPAGAQGAASSSA